MAFPLITGSQTSQTTVNGLTQTATMPSGIVAGELLLAIFSVDTTPTITIDTAFSGTGWTSLGRDVNSTIVTGTAFWKIATGSDALRINFSANAKGSAVVYRISGAASAAAAFANGSSTNSNPPALTPAGGAKDYLWIAARAGDSTVVATGIPTSYANQITLAALNTAGSSIDTCDRSLNAATEDPSAFTSLIEQWVCMTIAVVPVAPGVTLSAATGSFTTTGNPATLKVDRVLQAAAGAFATTGNPANLTISGGAPTLTALTIAPQPIILYDYDPWGAGTAAVTVTGTHNAPGAILQYQVEDAVGGVTTAWTDFTAGAGTAWSVVINLARRWTPYRIRVRGKVQTAVTAVQSANFYVGGNVAYMGQSLIVRPNTIAATATLTPSADTLWLLQNDVNGSLAAGPQLVNAAAVLGRRRAAQIAAAYSDCPVMIVDLGEVGTGRDEFSDANDTTNRSWATTGQAPMDYLRTRGTDVSLLVDHWFTNDASVYQETARWVAPFYLRQMINGVADNPDTSGLQPYTGAAVTVVPAKTYTPVHFLYDMTGGGQGLFDPARTKWVPLFGAAHTNNTGRSDGAFYANDIQKGGIRAALEDMAEIDSAFLPISLRSVPGYAGQAAFGGHMALPDGTHVAAGVDGEPLVAAHLMMGVMRAYGRLSRIEPRITTFNWATNGDFVDVNIRLPHGGTLSTPYLQNQAGAYAGSLEAANFPTPAVLPETSIAQLHNVQGFSIVQGGVRKFSGFTATIVNTGTGTGSGRYGTVRVRPAAKFVNGDTIAFGYADGHNLLTAADVTSAQPHIHWPIETRTHVNGGGYGFPVIRESGDLVLATAAGITGATTLVADTGTYAMTGSAAALRVNRVLLAAKGAFALVGGAVNLTITSGAALIKRGRSVSAITQSGQVSKGRK